MCSTYCDGLTLQRAAIDTRLHKALTSEYPGVLLFPPPDVWDALTRSNWYKGFRHGKSGIPGAGQGLFTIPQRAKGEVIGIYSGTHVPPNTSNGYVARANLNPLVLIDGTPTGGCDGTLMGYINDCYRQPHKYNCKLVQHNLIVATRLLRPREELFMRYASNNWDDIKVLVLAHLVQGVVGVARQLDIPDYAEPLAELCAWAAKRIPSDLIGMRRGSQLEILLMGCIDGDITFNGNSVEFEEIVHMVQPTAQLMTESFLNWLERVIRCRPFYEQACFLSWHSDCSWNFGVFSDVLIRAPPRPNARLASRAQCYYDGVGAPLTLLINAPPGITGGRFFEPLALVDFSSGHPVCSPPLSVTPCSCSTAGS